MPRKIASNVFEEQLQELLLDYVHCLKYYCSRLYEDNFKNSSTLTIEELDQFIIVLKSLRELLEAVKDHTPVTSGPLHPLRGKKNIQKKIQ